MSYSLFKYQTAPFTVRSRVRVYLACKAGAIERYLSCIATEVVILVETIPYARLLREQERTLLNCHLRDAAPACDACHSRAASHRTARGIWS